MNLFFESRFSPLLAGFPKNHSTQNALLNMIEKWKHALDKSEKTGTIFMDLCKAFDTLNHNLLLAKLNAYGFSFSTIKVIHSYLGSLLFKIFINDIFYFIQDAYICNFADDSSLYSIEDNFKEVKTMLKRNFELLQGWFYESHMVLNPGKCQYLTKHKDITNESIELDKKTLHDKLEQKFLGIITDKDLNFN